MKRKLLKKNQVLDEIHTQLYDSVTKLETDIISKIQKLKANPQGFGCDHFLQISEDCEDYDPEVNYYDKFWKKSLVNELTQMRVLEYEEYIGKFQQKIQKIEQLFAERKKMIEPYIKPDNRRKKQMELTEECPICSNRYSDRTALEIHLRVKHPNDTIAKEESPQYESSGIYQYEDRDES